MIEEKYVIDPVNPFPYIFPNGPDGPITFYSPKELDRAVEKLNDKVNKDGIIYIKDIPEQLLQFL